LRLRRILGACAGQHRERQKYNRDPRMARRGESDAHIVLSLLPAINPGAASFIAKIGGLRRSRLRQRQR
jgi:hypothetical protein